MKNLNRSQSVINLINISKLLVLIKSYSKFVDPIALKTGQRGIKIVQSIHSTINKIYKEIGGFDFKRYEEQDNYNLGKKEEREFKLI